MAQTDPIDVQGGRRWHRDTAGSGTATASLTADSRGAVEAVFREQSGRIMATLIRISGRSTGPKRPCRRLSRPRWPPGPVRPYLRHPAAWITAAAHGKLVDQSRRDRTLRNKEDALRYEIAAFAEPHVHGLEDASMHLPDDRLRLIFACCHPALNPEAQIALTLRTLGA